ncbi:tld protein, partial [Cystoisospora suis]
RQAGLPSSSSLAPSQLTLSPQARPHGGRLYRADSSSFSYQPPSRLSSSPRHKRRSSLSSSHEPPRIRSSTENDYPERNPTKEEEEEAEEGLHRRRHSITGLWHATHHRQDETKHRRKSKTSVSSSASPASLSFSSRLVSPVFHQHPDQQGSSSSSHFHRRASDVVTGAVGLGRRNSDTKNAGGGMMTRGRYSFLLHRNASSSSTSPIPGGDSHQLMREEERERDKKPGRDGILELQDDHEEEDNRKRDSHEEDDDEEEEEEEYDDEDEEEGSGENLVYADEPEQEEMYNKGDAYSLSSTHNFGSFRSRDRDLGSTSSLFTIPLPDYEIPQGAPALLNNNVVSQLAVHLPLMLTMKKWYLAFCHKLHGISLNTFYRRCSNIGPCVLLIQDGKGVLFGAFLDEIQLASKYYGTAETFVFTFKGSHGSNPDLDHASIHVYRWSKMNNYFIYTDYDVIGIGGGGHYAISVDKDLLRGSSSCCFTFNSPILSSSEDFIVKAFQIGCMQEEKNGACIPPVLSVIVESFRERKRTTRIEKKGNAVRDKEAKKNREKR